MVIKTLSQRAGDFLLHFESAQRCLNFGQITAPSSGGPFTLENVVAYPLLADNILAVAGDEADIVAFIIAGDPLDELADDGVTDEALYTILDDFTGVVVNRDALPANDAAATPGAFTIDDIVTTLQDTLLAKVVSEPPNTSTQVD